MGTGRQVSCGTLAILGVALAGCTVITIEDKSGATHVRRQFGVLQVQLASTCGSAIADVKALGLTVVDGSTTLGWVKGKQVVLHRSECAEAETSDSRSPTSQD